MKKELTLQETVVLMDDIIRFFESQLKVRLSLTRVEAPLYVEKESGLQDDLSGKEQAVCFQIHKQPYEIVHSLAKWKRVALKRYDFLPHTGILTEMRAIRKEEKMDSIHSYLVEQWDWERVILKEERTEAVLREHATSIYKAIRQTEIHIKRKCPHLEVQLPKKLFFISSQELEQMYPQLSSAERETEITKKYGAVFITQIGKTLQSGMVHDLRSPDYDDWELNGDLLIFDKVLDMPIEMTSMGIRVDRDSLLKQLALSGCPEKEKYPYHQSVLKEEVPFTIGGGIGRARLCLLLLGKRHIAEVQASSWSKEERDLFEKENYQIL